MAPKKDNSKQKKGEKAVEEEIERKVITLRELPIDLPTLMSATAAESIVELLLDSTINKMNDKVIATRIPNYAVKHTRQTFAQCFTHMSHLADPKDDDVYLDVENSAEVLPPYMDPVAKTPNLDSQNLRQRRLVLDLVSQSSVASPGANREPPSPNRTSSQRSRRASTIYQPQNTMLGTNTLTTLTRKQSTMRKPVISLPKDSLAAQVQQEKRRISQQLESGQVETDKKKHLEQALESFFASLTKPLQPWGPQHGSQKMLDGLDVDHMIKRKRTYLTLKDSQPMIGGRIRRAGQTSGDANNDSDEDQNRKQTKEGGARANLVDTKQKVTTDHQGQVIRVEEPRTDKLPTSVKKIIQFVVNEFGGDDANNSLENLKDITKSLIKKEQESLTSLFKEQNYSQLVDRLKAEMARETHLVARGQTQLTTHTKNSEADDEIQAVKPSSKRKGKGGKQSPDNKQKATYGNNVVDVKYMEVTDNFNCENGVALLEDTQKQNVKKKQRGGAQKNQKAKPVKPSYQLVKKGKAFTKLAEDNQSTLMTRSDYFNEFESKHNVKSMRKRMQQTINNNTSSVQNEAQSTFTAAGGMGINNLNLTQTSDFKNQTATSAFFGNQQEMGGGTAVGLDGNINTRGLASESSLEDRQDTIESKQSSSFTNPHTSIDRITRQDGARRELVDESVYVFQKNLKQFHGASMEQALNKTRESFGISERSRHLSVAKALSNRKQAKFTLAPRRSLAAEVQLDLAEGRKDFGELLGNMTSRNGFHGRSQSTSYNDPMSSGGRPTHLPPLNQTSEAFGSQVMGNGISKKRTTQPFFFATKDARNVLGSMDDPFETRKNKHLKLERLLNKEVNLKQRDMEKLLFQNPKMTQKNLVSIKSIQRKFGQSTVEMGGAVQLIDNSIGQKLNMQNLKINAPSALSMANQNAKMDPIKSTLSSKAMHKQQYTVNQV